MQGVALATAPKTPLPDGVFEQCKLLLGKVSSRWRAEKHLHWYPAGLQLTSALQEFLAAMARGDGWKRAITWRGLGAVRLSFAEPELERKTPVQLKGELPGPLRYDTQNMPHFRASNA